MTKQYFQKPASKIVAIIYSNLYKHEVEGVQTRQQTNSYQSTQIVVHLQNSNFTPYQTETEFAPVMQAVLCLILKSNLWCARTKYRAINWQYKLQAEKKFYLATWNAANIAIK